MQTKPFDSQIELTNDGELSVFFVGTGSAFSKKFYQTNFFLIKGNDHILIDCGTLFPYILETVYNTKLSSIKNILLTHPHADHIGGVEELALVNFYVTKTKPNLIIPQKFKKLLWNQSLKGGIQYSEYGKMSLNDYFSILSPTRIQKKPFDIYEIQIGSINLKLFRTYHITTIPNSLRKSQYSVGLIVDNRILFTCDSQYKPRQLETLLKEFKIEMIFHDCDIDAFSEGVHASYRQLKELPKDVKAKTILCHYSRSDISPASDGFYGLTQKGIYYIF